MNYLTNDPVQLRLALKTTAQVGVGALMILQFIYPERFAITGLYDEVKELARVL
jgi:hypothetical protein